MMKKQKILIVEDEKDIRELIHFHLSRSDFDVIEAASGDEAVEKAIKLQPDLILLDIMLPVFDGIEACKRVKSDNRCENIKIIFLSAKGEEDDIVTGLELGADDYITKPFSPKVLIARVKSTLRSHIAAEKDLLSSHGIQLDESRKKVVIDNNEISLSMTEFQLLKLFMSMPGHVYTRGQIVDKIKGDNHAVTDRSVDTQLVSLRKKMGIHGKLIETVWGVGYRFRENEA